MEDGFIKNLWRDVAKATGVAFSEIDGVGVLGIEAFKLIGKVWESEKVPMRELVCLLDKQNRK
ncbi:MAG: hypothetical protein RLZZ490_2091 [Cyanobacteriota bacterium]|jgi:hypothetical protein